MAFSSGRSIFPVRSFPSLTWSVLPPPPFHTSSLFFPPSRRMPNYSDDFIPNNIPRRRRGGGEEGEDFKGATTSQRESAKSRGGSRQSWSTCIRLEKRNIHDKLANILFKTFFKIRDIFVESDTSFPTAATAPLPPPPPRFLPNRSSMALTLSRPKAARRVGKGLSNPASLPSWGPFPRLPAAPLPPSPPPGSAGRPPSLPTSHSVLLRYDEFMTYFAVFVWLSGMFTARQGEGRGKEGWWWCIL